MKRLILVARDSFARRPTRAAPLLLVLFSSLMVLAGCMEERPPIDRTQAWAFPKSFFLGKDLKSIDDDPEFFMRHTLIDVGYGAAHSWMMTSMNGQVSRVRWEITENYLNARLAYERVEGTDGKGEKFTGLQRKTTNDGQVIASFKILSHFDIKRAYNPTTGEALNVIEENTTDRKWYEREYVRVDWSKNETTASYDFDLPSMLGQIGGYAYEPIPYYVGDKNDPNAPFLDLDSGYFDVTMKAFAHPKTITLKGETIPACMLYSWVKGSSMPWGNCNPEEITLRLAFKKVVDTDYEPKNYDGVQTRAFGGINYTFRRGYERNYGMVDDKWYRFAALYNIWKRSHYYADSEAMTGPVACATADSTALPTKDPAADPNRDMDKNGTADECEAVTQALGVGGSQCDVFKKKCTLPYANREVATVAWYSNGNFDADLFEASSWSVEDWDVALRSAVQVARLVECRRAKGGDCDNKFPMWVGQMDDYQDAVTLAREIYACRRAKGWADASCGDELVDSLTAGLAAERKKPASDINIRAMNAILKAPPVMVLCHNPVVKEDAPACGKEGLAPRFGDLRYNTLFNIFQPQNPSPWAITADGEDPLTGEKIGGNISMWTYLTDLAAQSLVDLVRYMNGELKTEDITNGKYIHNWVQANRVRGGMGATMSKEEITRRVAAAANLGPEDFLKALSKPMSAELQTAARQVEAKVSDIAVSADVASPSAAEIEARLRLVRGTPTEAKLINQPMLQLAGLPPGAQDTAAASPLSINNPKLRADIRQRLALALANRGAEILFEAPEPFALSGLADVLRKKFPPKGKETELDKKARLDAMFQYIRRRYQYGVIAHEFGHSVGLVHNFAGSASPAFYLPQYWQLRTKNGKVNNVCNEAVDDGAQCVGPRYFDPVTAEEQDQLIWMFGQTSSMDYPGDVAQDFLGVNVYDVAAARMFYGDNVAVFADTDLKAGSPIGVGLASAMDSFGGMLGIQYRKPSTGGSEPFHYSELQKNWKLIDNCYPVKPQAPNWWNPQRDGTWNQVLDGRIVSIDGMPTKCRQRTVDYVGWRDLRMPTDQELGGVYYRGGPSIDARGRVRVPYAFGSDRWADVGNTSVFRHDAGADAYEQAMFLINTQETQHIFDNFRRGRSSFSVVGAADRSFSRFNEKLVGIAGGMAFYNSFYKKISNEIGVSFNDLWPAITDRSFRTHLVAASVVFDHFTRQLTRPEDGPHYALPASYNDPVLSSVNDSYNANADKKASVIIPNGSSGYIRDVGFGGRPLENALDERHGDFDTEYTANVGSYYDKINSIIHMSISEDRFVSQSRQDFYDARFRANGMADLFPDGYRRVIANALTNDRALMAAHIAADANGSPILNNKADPLDPLAAKYPATPIGWTSWWPATGPAMCFPSQGRHVCAYDAKDLKLKPELPEKVVAVDPQIGWEVQKFILAYVLAYIPANAQSKWLDMMKVYRLGPETTPAFENRIEWQDPQSGQVYFAKTYGKECLFGKGASCDGGKIVQKGIAARVLEYANELTAKGYKLDTGACPATAGYAAGFNKYGKPCMVNQPDGTPVVVADPAVGGLVGPNQTCDQNANPSCKPLTEHDNHYAFDLTQYKSVVDYMWELLVAFRYGSFKELGVAE